MEEFYACAKKQFIAVMVRVNDFTGHFHGAMVIRQVERRHMYVQFDELHTLHIVIEENIRPLQGNILDEAVEYPLSFDKGIHMPSDMGARLAAAFFMRWRICRDGRDCNSLRRLETGSAAGWWMGCVLVRHDFA